MKRSKPLVLALCAVLLVVGTILGTVAYLQDTASVVNTFTVGNVHLKLDEAVVDEKGEPTGGRTETGNAYHLIPGETYTKDPTVTVLKGSEESYVRMMLTLNCASELDAIFAHLYGLSTEDLRYILDPEDVCGKGCINETFRVLKEREYRELGEYRTKRLVMEAWNKLGFDR